MADPLLQVTDLRMHFPVGREGARGILPRPAARLRAVDGVSFSVSPGGSLGLVGESGCGKSTTARLVTRLLRPTSGSIRFAGVEVAALGHRGLRPHRRFVQMVFQDPDASLNPRQTVGSILSAPLQVHGLDRAARRTRADELLTAVGLDSGVLNRYPAQLSGGQRQRVAIARALAPQPRLLVADEPVSALDVSVRAQVVNLLEDLRRDLGLGYLLIAHDLGVVRQLCEDVAVMYLGKIVETAPTERLYRHAHHPYTIALLSAVPDLARVTSGRRRERVLLPGEVPSAVAPPSGCRFRTRCWRAEDVCAVEEPPLLQVAPGHRVACHFAREYDAARDVTSPAAG